MRRTIPRLVRENIHAPRLRKLLKSAEDSYEMARNHAARVAPALMSPSPRMLTVAITAKCNLRCTGCRYGRDYMTGGELPTALVKQLLRDAAAGGMSTVRLYGGEPLLHPGLDEMIAESRACGITPFVSTNGRLLRRRLPAMYAAGLRVVTFGYYGHGETYDTYVGRKGAWDQFEAAVAWARDRYADELSLHVSFVLNTRTCSLDELEKAWEFVRRFGLRLHIDLVHYSLPYFTEGPERELQFNPSHASRIAAFVERLAELKAERPDLYAESKASIRAIPDWLLKGPAMRIPCDAYDMMWVGADGSVRLCFVTFPLGNLHEKPLSEMLFTREHRDAAVGALKLECPNCHCGREPRVHKHLPSLLKYSLGGSSIGQYGGEAPLVQFPILGQNEMRSEDC